MKKFLVLGLMLTSIGAYAGSINVKVSGMVCSMCAQGIQKKFSSQSAVKELEVNMDQKVVNIQTHEGADISDEQVTKLITEAGYNVASIERK